MIVNDIIASAYVLLDNASEEELDRSVVIERFGSVINMMKQENILGNGDSFLRKSELTFPDTTGLITNNEDDFGNVVYLEFNTIPVDESTVAMLDMYAGAGIQRVAFWTDADSGLNKIQLAIAEVGTLKIWYEPDSLQSRSILSTVELADSLYWCIASRLAASCIAYVKFSDPKKLANIPVLAQQLREDAIIWRDIYLEKINKIGTNRPWQRLPFMASRNNF